MSKFKRNTAPKTEKTFPVHDKWAWSKQNQQRAQDIKEVVENLEDWWPLTVRQIYYQVLSNNSFDKRIWKRNYKGTFEAIQNPYGAISMLLK